MNGYKWLEDYINDKQKLIDIILERKNENGICEIKLEEIALKLNIKEATVRNKIKAINTDEEIIREISNNEIVIKKEDYKNTKTCEQFKLLLLYFSIEENFYKNEKTIIEETGVSYKWVHFFITNIRRR